MGPALHSACDRRSHAEMPSVGRGAAGPQNVVGDGRTATSSNKAARGLALHRTLFAFSSPCKVGTLCNPSKHMSVLRFALV